MTLSGAFSFVTMALCVAANFCQMVAGNICAPIKKRGKESSLAEVNLNDSNWTRENRFATTKRNDFGRSIARPENPSSLRDCFTISK
jgi:hypothetical protein